MGHGMTPSPHPPHFFQVPGSQRRMAYSVVGDANSTHTLLCVPGLLETRGSFDPLLHAAQGVGALRVISLDLCGRGDSDPLPGDKGYSMRVYLQDLLAFIGSEVLTAQGAPAPRLELLGTSMGGLLAMYLVEQKQHPIAGLFLNDIGLSLNWMSIYGLYGGAGATGRRPEPEALAKEWNVHVGVVRAVRQPTHFDLPYRKDWMGMQFAHLLEGFEGPLRLLRGGQSGVCLDMQVQDLKQAFAQTEVLEVPGAGHPVPFTPTVCDFVIRSLNLPLAQAPAVPPADSPPEPAKQLTPASQVELPIAPPLQAVPEARAEPALAAKPRLFTWFKRLFNNSP
jgi:pimeloyl-ACP methyl ester carboxylesterase